MEKQEKQKPNSKEGTSAGQRVMVMLMTRRNHAARKAGRQEERDANAGAGVRMSVTQGRKSLSQLEFNAASVAAFLGVKVMAADMPDFMQVHAFRCARRAYDDVHIDNKFSSKKMAHDIKKEFDKVYGVTWHCVVGTSYGSFVTHSTGCFLYFSVEKMLVMLFRTKTPAMASS
ncbi:uncharacterized protein LOC120259263 [Dioscorea cayenensis subsp. rotundata]|uniref:Dynein light chain n=1 Tax=Dioscorea cayennensis subsp. rotundata TaxID=55577 RepID=A0AB40B700_DIOCR|nr:uncharacterized protein LOC120259263 [Dioscorea cayenensis subsp. rotundata]XP_039122772.1 uncharacterized protein LOC120259263 [Dioscorea cayenensis subsp. rotundata]